MHSKNLREAEQKDPPRSKKFTRDAGICIGKAGRTNTVRVASSQAYRDILNKQRLDAGWRELHVEYAKIDETPGSLVRREKKLRNP